MRYYNKYKLNEVDIEDKFMSAMIGLITDMSMNDKCREFEYINKSCRNIAKLVIRDIKSLSTFPEEKRHNNDFKKPCPMCDGKGTLICLGETVSCNNCHSKGFIKS